MTPDAKIIADRYEVIRSLGHGAFANTLLARDMVSGQQVAVKILHPRRATDWKAFQLFEREIEVLKSLAHPGIPVVYEARRVAWDGADCACFVMEFVDGKSFADITASGERVEPDRVRDWFVQLLDVLEYLHSLAPPVLHRDVKPSNIIVRRNESPTLVDFGAVRNVFRRADESGSTVVGTFGYMPFEQYMGKASPSSDLYGLAATFLHLMTGRPPSDFMSDDGQIVVPPDLPCDDALAAIIRKLLSPTPRERYQSATEVKSAMQTGVALVRNSPPIFHLPPGRRDNRDIQKLLSRGSYSLWQLAEVKTLPDDRASLFDVAVFTFFSVLTAGIMPILLWSRARGRKRRLKRFFEFGVLTRARILELQDEKIEFDVKLTRVRYEFFVGTQRHIGTDRVLPVYADRWELGSEIPALVLPDQDFDSVVVTA